MSLGDGSGDTGPGEAGDAATTVRTQLRALAHPVRLRILSLLTGSPMTAAEAARELGMSHANVSYHLRQLLAGGVIEVAGEERINGGVARRYRYDIDADRARRPRGGPPDGPPTRDHRLVYAAVSAELQRRAARLRRGPGNHLTDAELWVEPDVWRQVLDLVGQASELMHRAALPPRTPGAVQVNATMALFEMEAER
jgi:DNA-binding transcriptional ArsR family regulator